MAAKVIPFPTRTPQRSQARAVVPYPTGSTVICEDATLEIDPIHRVFDVLPIGEEEAAGEPQVFSLGGNVVLDLGECLPDRTLLTLKPDTAYEWAKCLLRAARAARNQGG